jgi:hypothetical protein
MKDNELRAVVLQKYYDLRDRDYFQWSEVKLEESFPIKTFNVLGRICNQLGEQNLIDWKPVENGMGNTVGGIGKITAFGVDVVEGTAKSPIAITFDHRQTVTIHGSNNIVGNNNQLSLERVNSEINQSSFSEAEKAEAKSLWQKVCENKLLNTVVGSVLGTATKHVLETSTHPK